MECEDDIFSQLNALKWQMMHLEGLVSNRLPHGKYRAGNGGESYAGGGWAPLGGSGGGLGVRVENRGVQSPLPGSFVSRVHCCGNCQPGCF